MRLHWLAAAVLMAACSRQQGLPKAHGSGETAPVTPLDATTALRHLSSASSQTTWDAPTVVQGDLDCDGAPDAAALGRENGGVVVGVVRAAGGAPALLRFAIDPSVQAAVCSEPVGLALESQAEADLELEGFQPTDSCKGLVLTGGECDAVHLYWHRTRGQVAWWRN